MEVCYVPWLHMHQPFVLKNSTLISNIEKMLYSSDKRERWDAKLILRAYKNPAKYVEILAEEGKEPRIILDFSGTLLESLKDLDERNVTKKVFVGEEAIGPIIELYKKVLKKFPYFIEFAGTAYSHCYFPITPQEDWQLQIEEWRKTFRKIFGKVNLDRVKGFWLPEMGIIGREDALSKLIECIKKYYDWLILPLQVVQGYENLSYEKRIQMASQPHLLKAMKQEIIVIFRSPTYFIDQQAGCDADLLYNKCLEARKMFKSDKPALVVPASDGENGNVMMNEFFPKTFLPFFREKIGRKIFSLSITEFLEKFYKNEIKSEIKIKDIGGSWVNGHEQWTLEERRRKLIEEIRAISRDFHKVEDRIEKDELEEMKRLLLIAETSCYTYWNVEYWFEQGERIISFLRQKIARIKVNI